jgi:hypothetical protein
MAEQTYGAAGVEKEAGYEPLIPKEDTGESFSNPREAAAALSKPPKDEPLKISVIDPETGEEADPSKTLTVEQAAEITGKQMAERDAAKQFADDAAFQAAIDDGRGRAAHAYYDWNGRPIEIPTELPADKGKPLNIQSEATTEPPVKSNPTVETEIDPEDGLTPATRDALNNPQIRQEVAQRFQEADSAREQYTNATLAAAQMGVAALMIDMPEFSNVPIDQWNAVIAVLNQSDPQRANQAVSRLQSVGAMMAQYQAHKQQTAQRQAAQFSTYAQQQDAEIEREFKDVPEAERTKLANEVRNALKDYGVKDEDIHSLWNSNPLFRSAAAQRLMADAARYRLAKRTAMKLASKPIPPVQKPGNAIPAPNRALNSQIAALEAKNSLSIKEAAKLMELKAQKATRNAA